MPKFQSEADRLRHFESRVLFEAYIKSKLRNERGNPLPLDISPPSNDCSAWIKIQTGAVNTTGAEYQGYIGTTIPVDPPVPPTTVPDPPTGISATTENGQSVISFTPPTSDGGSTILYYTVTSSPGGITAYGTSSPITILGLSNNTSYTFTVTATNAIGVSTASTPSSSVTPTNPSSSAPTITSVYPTNNSIVVNFTAPASFGTLTNYEYSIDGGSTFTALSPTDTSSPITIPSLSPSTLYTIAIRALNNVPATGDPSNIVPVTTKTTLVTLPFTTVGTQSWTPPLGVQGVQYLVVGGGGGGGGCYSKVTVLGNVPIQSTPPVGGGYWIYDGTTTANYTKGRMYNGANVNPNYTTFPDPVRLTAVGTTFNPYSFPVALSQWITANIELVYNWSSALPIVTNFGYPSSAFVNSSLNNNISGGGGGGAGGQAKAIFVATSFYPVKSDTAYTVIVGDGGDGGTAGVDTESAGTKGGDSTFDTITSEGGSGGQPSRVLTDNTDGFNEGGRGRTTLTNLIGGFGGRGLGGLGSGGTATSAGNAGAASLVGPIMGDGVAYSGGAASGLPNTVNVTAPVANRGYGGAGTGCTLNSFAPGVKGGSGVVILKYYI